MSVKATKKGKGTLEFSLEAVCYLCDIPHTLVVWIRPYDQIPSLKLVLNPWKVMLIQLQLKATESLLM